MECHLNFLEAACSCKDQLIREETYQGFMEDFSISLTSIKIKFHKLLSSVGLP